MLTPECALNALREEYEAAAVLPRAQVWERLLALIEEWNQITVGRAPLRIVPESETLLQIRLEAVHRAYVSAGRADVGKYASHLGSLTLWPTAAAWAAANP